MHVTLHIRPSCFSVCNIEKLGIGLGTRLLSPQPGLNSSSFIRKQFLSVSIASYTLIITFSQVHTGHANCPRKKFAITVHTYMNIF